MRESLCIFPGILWVSRDEETAFIQFTPLDGLAFLLRFRHSKISYLGGQVRSPRLWTENILVNCIFAVVRNFIFGNIYGELAQKCSPFLEML